MYIRSAERLVLHIVFFFLSLHLEEKTSSFCGLEGLNVDNKLGLIIDRTVHVFITTVQRSLGLAYIRTSEKKIIANEKSVKVILNHATAYQSLPPLSRAARASISRASTEYVISAPEARHAAKPDLSA